ncbi:MAG: peptidoglycan-binding protein [Burkholderiales bacterium]|nr:peptidoglycan-binding protein [Burkholderiales bacterium]
MPAVGRQAAPRPFSQPEPIRQELRFGMASRLIRELQIRLRHAKYLAILDADNRFGMQTRAAVVKFQQENGIRATGIVDQKTWDALLPKSHHPTEAELSNIDVGPWFTGPKHRGYMMELQHRLNQIGLYQGPVDGAFDAPTREAIGAFRARIGLPAAEIMDERTWANLIRVTRNPRYAELFDAPPASALTQELDPRCAAGRVVCISKEQRRMSYVVDGKVRFTREARFSRPGYDSPVGAFRVWYMNRDTISTIFGERTPMPYAIFYTGNVAIHFSDDFAEKGYESGSHGCSQLKDYQVAMWLYEQIKVGDRVVVY